MFTNCCYDYYIVIREREVLTRTWGFLMHFYYGVTKKDLRFMLQFMLHIYNIHDTNIKEKTPPGMRMAEQSGSNIKSKYEIFVIIVSWCTCRIWIWQGRLIPAWQLVSLFKRECRTETFQRKLGRSYYRFNFLIQIGRKLAHLAWLTSKKI